jgi:hypothetical protein
VLAGALGSACKREEDLKMIWWLVGSEIVALLFCFFILSTVLELAELVSGQEHHYLVKRAIILLTALVVYILVTAALIEFHRR